MLAFACLRLLDETPMSDFLQLRPIVVGLRLLWPALLRGMVKPGLTEAGSLRPSCATDALVLTS